MKKIINNCENIVSEMSEGLVNSSKNLELVHGYNTIIRKDISEKVGLISGGGSGHEPAHGGFVGYGMLDAACNGEIFTSPTPDQILSAIKAVDRRKGV
ncbi:MAG: dihydroxyacetone kinase subunit DhaK, partial [Thiobacillus sp.]